MTTTSTPFPVSVVGIGYKHPPGFVIDRPSGFGEDVFALFLVPVQVLTADGRQQARANTCIIYTAAHPEWYCGDGVGLDNHWFHAAGLTLRQLAQRYNVPLNRIIPGVRPERIQSLLTGMRTELERPQPHSHRQIELLLEQLCIELDRARSDQSVAAQSTPRQRELLDAFQTLRDAVRHQPQEPWSVGTMAARVHLSPSRFTSLYQQFFGTSPHDDLLTARLERAKWLLAATTQSVAEVATQSGFASIYHFSRLFRKKIGCPPTAFVRQSHEHHG